MSKLQKLYDMIQYSKELNLPLPDEYLQQANELEEEIIKKEILPILSEKIEPLLGQIKRELVLVIDYIPDESLSVKLSRKRNFGQELKEAKEIIADPDPQVEHNTGNIKREKHKKAGKTNLKVSFSDGSVVENRFAKDTLLQVVQKIGIDKVRSVGVIQCGVPLISNTIDSVYGNSQVDVADGWYLITHSSTGQKKQQIEKIADALGIDMKVEIL
ncbi:MAG: hypothetical protein RR313_11560 [Anaerovoracaceae bacterium]